MVPTKSVRSAVAAVVMAATCALSLAAASPVSASPDSSPRVRASGSAEAPAALLHGDACGPTWAAAVPDSGYAPFYFNFHDACHFHDDCYGSAPYGRHEVGRAKCDNGFLSRMNGWCNDRYSWWHPGRGNCRNVALTYYAAVRAGGAVSFY